MCLGWFREERSCLRRWWTYHFWGLFQPYSLWFNQLHCAVHLARTINLSSHPDSKMPTFRLQLVILEVLHIPNAICSWIGPLDCNQFEFSTNTLMIGVGVEVTCCRMVASGERSFCALRLQFQVALKKWQAMFSIHLNWASGFIDIILGAQNRGLKSCPLPPYQMTVVGIVQGKPFSEEEKCNKKCDKKKLWIFCCYKAFPMYTMKLTNSFFLCS